MCNARRKRRFADVQLVEEDAAKVGKKCPACVMCRIQEGDIDSWREGPSGRLLIKLKDGTDDYCYCLIVLQYNTMAVKDVCVSLVLCIIKCNMCQRV